MNKAQLDALLACGVALDTETHLIQPGLLSPPLVVGSAASWEDGKPAGALLPKDKTRSIFEALLRDPKLVIVGANIAYDMLVLAVDAARRGVDLMPQIFAAYEQGRVFDVQIAEALHAVSIGMLGKDPRTNSPLRDPITHKTPARYSLAVCTDLVLGRVNAKANDRFRESYQLLEDIPIESWPAEARVYPIDDAVNTFEVALAQAGLIIAPQPHQWPSGGPGSDSNCRACGCSIYEAVNPCTPRKQRHRNMHDLAAQTYSHFAMHLGAAWGFSVDQAAVDEVEKRVMAGRPERAVPFFETGIFRWKKEKGVKKAARHMSVIKRKVALAYGCSGVCTFCEGRGKVPSPIAKMRTCGRKCVGPSCLLCGGTGNRWDKLINCKPCDATGFDLNTAVVPRTDGSKCKPCSTTGTLPDGEECDECNGTGIVQGIGTGRDVLQESGDEELINLAEYLEDAKIPESYIPWLRRARTPITGHNHDCPILTDFNNDCACPGPWRDIPLCLRPNVLLETGRTSYSGVVQLLPRKGGIRECIVARPGCVFVSVDYEAGELVTHGQSTLWITGKSLLADALNNEIKVHNAFAATVLGISYEEFQRRFKAGDKQCIDIRQAAKPANFGFPGRMGAAKLVIQQRKQGPDTACENGSTWITITLEDGTDIEVRGYKGLRFCVLMDGAKTCGDVKVSETNGRPHTPACKACIECATRLRAKWLQQWPENVPYFDFIKYVEENGQPLTPEQRLLFGEAALAPGEIVQHVSNRIRGGATGNALANGYFQGLLADAAKSALRRVSRECYDSSFRLPDGSRSPLYGARVIVFQHDEIIAELPETTAHEAAMRLSEIMVEELRKYCPDLAKACKADPALMRRWYKGAAPCYANANGPCKQTDPGARLVPWEPKPKKAAA